MDVRDTGRPSTWFRRQAGGDLPEPASWFILLMCLSRIRACLDAATHTLNSAAPERSRLVGVAKMLCGQVLSRRRCRILPEACEFVPMRGRASIYGRGEAGARLRVDALWTVVILIVALGAGFWTLMFWVWSVKFSLM